MEKQGKIIVIVAPSGTGKSTLIKRIKDHFPVLRESVSYTTRKPREGEVDGVAYNFVSEEDFLKMRDNNEFLEWAEVHGNYYGTNKNFVQSQLDQGQCVLFDLDVQGTDEMKKYFGDQAQVVFIAPPSIEELEKRLTNRGTESEESLSIRLNNAKNELKRKDDYDFCVINDDLERAYSRLKDVFEGIINS
jgi:guanylate kinase